MNNFPWQWEKGKRAIPSYQKKFCPCCKQYVSKEGKWERMPYNVKKTEQEVQGLLDHIDPVVTTTYSVGEICPKCVRTQKIRTAVVMIIEAVIVISAITSLLKLIWH